MGSDPLLDTVAQIQSITAYLSTNKGTVRSLVASERAKFAQTIEQALTLIVGQLAAVDVRHAACRDSFCRALAMLPGMLPQDLASVLCKLFDQTKVQGWFALLVPQLVHAHTLALQEALVVALATLASLVQHSSLASLRRCLVGDMLEVLCCAGGALKQLALSGLPVDSVGASAALARPVEIKCFNGLRATSALELCALHESAVSLLGYLCVGIGPFVADKVGVVWAGACEGLMYGRPALVTQSLGCLLQLASREPLPASCQEDLMHGICRLIHPSFGQRSAQLESLLARTIEALLSPHHLAPLALCGATASFCPLLESAALSAGAPLLRALLKLFAACQRSSSKPLVEALMPIIGRAGGADEELAACLVEAGRDCRVPIQRLASRTVVSHLDDAPTLLMHTRVICTLCRVFFAFDGRMEGWDAIPRLVVSLVHSLQRTLRPADPQWCPHATTLFSFAATHATHLLAFFGSDTVQVLHKLAFLGWIEPARVLLCDAATTAAAVACLELLGAVPVLNDNALLLRCRDVIHAAILQAGNVELHVAGLAALRSWLVRAPTEACSDAAKELLAGVKRDDLRNSDRLHAIVDLVGLCACGAAATLERRDADVLCAVCDAHLVYDAQPSDAHGSSQHSPPSQRARASASTSAHTVALAPWKSLLVDLLHAGTGRDYVLAALDALPRVLSHARSKDLAALHDSLPALFDYARHDHADVRAAFARLVPSLCQLMRPLVEKLVPYLSLRLRDCKPAVQCSVLETMARVASREPEDSSWFFAALMALITMFNHADLSVRAAAYNGVRDVAQAHNLTEQQLFFEHHQREIFTILVNQLAPNASLLDEVAQYLDVDTVELLRRTMPGWLPKLVASESADVLTQVAARLGVSLGEMLTAHCVPIILFILVEEPKHDVSRHFLATHTGMDITRLMDSWLHDLMRELVIMLGDSNERVRQRCVLGINTLGKATSYAEGDGKKPPAHWDHNELASFVARCFLAIENHLVHTLLPTNDNYVERRSAILGFAELLKLMAQGKEPHLEELRPKILVILKLALRQADLQAVASDVFLQYLKALGIANVGKMLGQIVVDLLPLVTQDAASEASQHVVSILEWLMVDNADVLAPHFKDVHFLPETPQLARVRASWDKHTGHAKKEGVIGLLSQLAVGLEHESLSVRLTAVTKLCSVLREHRDEIDTRLLQRERVDAVIESMLPHLLRGQLVSTDTRSTSEAKEKYAECLGLLGAIDPSRVELRLRSELALECADPRQLAFELLVTQLLPALEDAKNPESQDRAAYAIQEVLRFVRCDKNTPDLAQLPAPPKRELRGAVQFWKDLLPEQRAVVKPYLSSKYVLAELRPVEPREPFYSQHTSFRKWLGNFAGHLISRVEDRTLKDLFNACRSSVKDHEATARFLLPYLVLHVAAVPEVQDQVVAELCAVLRADGAKSRDMSQLCSQTVFHAIDVLWHWTNEKRKDMAVAAQSAAHAAHVNRNAKQGTPKRAKTSASLDPVVELSREHDAVQTMLERIPPLLIAEAAFRCGAYARALKCVEGHVRTLQDRQPERHMRDLLSSEIVSFLQRICGGLDDGDALEGLAKLRRSQTAPEQILDLEHRGCWADALDWYDAAMHGENSNVELRLGQLRCMLNLGRFETMLALVRSGRARGTVSIQAARAGEGDDMQSRRESLAVAGALIAAAPPQWGGHASGDEGADGKMQRHSSVVMSQSMQFLSYGMQAAWRLSHWQEVEAFAECNLAVDDFEANIGRTLLHLVHADRFAFCASIQRARVEVMGPLLAASMDSYHRSFPYVLSLHLLSELESLGTSILDGTMAQHVSTTSKAQWSARLRMTPPVFKTRTQILHLRRVVMQVHAGASAEPWVQIARAARGDGQLEAARSALVHALSIDPCDTAALTERAQLLWSQGKRQQGIQEVEQVVALSPSVSSQSGEATFEQRRRRAKPELLLGRWLHDTGQKTYNDIRKQFEQVTAICPEWENGHFYLASYLDHVVKSIEAEFFDNSPESVSARRESLRHVPMILQSYRKALQHGHKHIHQALPRMLTLYFRHARDVIGDSAAGGGGAGVKKSEDAAQSALNNDMCDQMKLAIKNVPTYTWLSAMPQIISRVCHDNPSVKSVLSTLIQKMFRKYPHQCIWMAMGVLRAKHREQAKNEIRSIVEKAISGREDMKRVHDDALEFAHLLSLLCKHPFGEHSPTKVKLSTVTRLAPLRKLQSLEVLVPTEAFLSGTLPLDNRSNDRWDPFSGGDVQTAKVQAVLDEVEVIRSLQSPKVVTFLGTNGVHYRFLAKPKDDLRKDSRVMEVNSLVNKLLHRDMDSRRRQLRIQTYAVIPMDEETGLIEWVPDLKGAHIPLCLPFVVVFLKYLVRLSPRRAHATTSSHQQRCQGQVRGELCSCARRALC